MFNSLNSAEIGLGDNCTFVSIILSLFFLCTFGTTTLLKTNRGLADGVLGKPGQILCRQWESCDSLGPRDISNFVWFFFYRLTKFWLLLLYVSFKKYVPHVPYVSCTPPHIAGSDFYAKDLYISITDAFRIFACESISNDCFAIALRHTCGSRSIFQAISNILW